MRTQEYGQQLATALGDHARFAMHKQEQGHCVESVVRSAPLQDIGQVGIPDHIQL
jgi:putative two-component system response regulator